MRPNLTMEKPCSSSPSAMNDSAAKVCEIVARHLSIGPDRVSEIRPLIDVDLDSLRLIELFLEIERVTGCGLNDYVARYGGDFAMKSILDGLAERAASGPAGGMLRSAEPPSA